MFKSGQKVYCLGYGEGTVAKENSLNPTYPVKVNFPNGSYNVYTAGGKLHYKRAQRTLFNSKEEAIAFLTTPPKLVFLPALKKGQKLIARSKTSGYYRELEVHSETEERVYGHNGNAAFLKTDWEFFNYSAVKLKLGVTALPVDKDEEDEGCDE